MQKNDENQCLLSPDARFKCTPSPLRSADNSPRIITTASAIDPKALSKLLFEETFDKESLNKALINVYKTTYTHSWSHCPKFLETFFSKGLFESHKKACICLLEDALAPYQEESKKEQ